MGLKTSIQQFLERLNDLNRWLLYFPERHLKQVDQDENVEILDHAKARNPEWYEAMVNANIYWKYPSRSSQLVIRISIRDTED
jgi:hypothetical protein